MLKTIKNVSKPSFASQKIFSENFVAIYVTKLVSTLDKQLSVRVCFLDCSKLLIYEFHYKYIKVEYGSSAKLLFTDTDRLVYKIETDGIYKNRSMFDLFDYTEDSKFFDLVNKKVTGQKKMKSK